MHPILLRAERIGLYAAGWVMLAVLFSILLHFSQGFEVIRTLSLLAPMTLVFAFMALAPWYTCPSFPLGKTRLVTLIGVHTLAAILTSFVWILIGQTIASAGANVFGIKTLEDEYRAMMPMLFATGVLLFTLSVVVHYLILAFEESRDVEKKALTLEVLARESELKALRAQINPHFLFNSLNAISALTASDPANARAMTLRLASFFRETLKLGSLSTITVEQELRLLDDFLAVEKVRFGQRLQLHRKVDDDARACLLPALILQPIIENAINHGIVGLVDGGTISLNIEKRQTGLRVTVENLFDADNRPPQGTKVGLTNVRGRLNILYGLDARLDTQVNGETFLVELLVPQTTSDDIQH